MEIFDQIIAGFGVALTLENIYWVVLGSLLGTIVGILPGLGSPAAIAMLLPLTFELDVSSALIMLAGIYYGASMSGSITSIVLNIPGTPSNVVSCFDGYPMTLQGRAGPALFAQAIASFVAGSICILIITFFSPPLASLALEINSPDYAMLLLLALTAAATLATGPFLISLAMLALGLFLGTIGIDLTTGEDRYTFGIIQLTDGLNFVVVSVGLFAIGQVIAELAANTRKDMKVATKFKELLVSLVPTRDDWRRIWGPMFRGTAIGSIYGPIPGTGQTISAFTSYMVEKKISKTPERFGKGAIEGLAGPEAADNASAMTSFIPMLTLGIPTGVSMALMLGALTVHGVTPGPRMMSDHPDIFWGVIASMWVGNFSLLILNLPLIGIWIRLLQMDFRLLFPAILIFCCLGVYSADLSAFSLFIALAFGLLGCIFFILDCPRAPLIMGFILGPMLEENFRRSMIISDGEFWIFLSRPIAAVCLLGVVLLLGYGLKGLIEAARQERGKTVPN